MYRSWNLHPTIPNQDNHNPPPPSVIIEEMEEYAIEEIFDSRLYRKKPQYLIQWVGYPHLSWEPAEYHKQTSAISTFHERYPMKLGPCFDVEGEEV